MQDDHLRGGTVHEKQGQHWLAQVSTTHHVAVQRQHKAH